MKVVFFGILKANEMPLDVENSVIFTEGKVRKFATLDAIAEGDEIKALEGVLKYCGTLKEEAAKIETRYNQKVRTIAPRVLQNIQISGRIALQVEEKAGVKGLAIPSVYENDGCTVKPWRNFKKEVHNVCCAFVEACEVLTIENLNIKTEAKETETPTEAPKAKDKKEKAKV